MFRRMFKCSLKYNNRQEYFVTNQINQRIQKATFQIKWSQANKKKSRVLEKSHFRTNHLKFSISFFFTHFIRINDRQKHLK